MIAVYNKISTRKPQTVFKVLRGDDTRRYGEASFKTEEDGCHIFGIPGHFYRTCKFFNKKYSLEQNQRYYKKKHGVESTDDVKAPQGESTRGGAAPRAGGATGTRKAPNNNSRSNNSGGRNNNTSDGEEKHEQARVAKELDMAGVIDARLGDEEFGLICKCEGNTIDLLLDTGTVPNLVPEDQRGVVQNIYNEKTSLIGVGGARVLATETGQAGVFGKSRIVPGTGAICISQRQFGDKFQMSNPHKDLVILRGWPHTRFANRE